MCFSYHRVLDSDKTSITTILPSLPKSLVLKLEDCGSKLADGGFFANVPFLMDDVVGCSYFRTNMYSVLFNLTYFYLILKATNTDLFESVSLLIENLFIAAPAVVLPELNRVNAFVSLSIFIYTL